MWPPKTTMDIPCGPTYTTLPPKRGDRGSWAAESSLHFIRRPLPLRRTSLPTLPLGILIVPNGSPVTRRPADLGVGISGRNLFHRTRHGCLLRRLPIHRRARLFFLPLELPLRSGRQFLRLAIPRRLDARQSVGCLRYGQRGLRRRARQLPVALGGARARRYLDRMVLPRRRNAKSRPPDRRSRQLAP